MKFQFDANLDYQQEAIESITSIFEGQEVCRTNFTVAPLQYSPQVKLAFETSNDLGVGNRLKLLDDDILKNIRNIQLKNGLAPTEKLN